MPMNTIVSLNARAGLTFSIGWLSLMLLVPGIALASSTAGLSVPGTNVYPYAAMYRVASALSGPVTVTNAASVYAAACDLTLATHYALFISSRNPCVFYKVRLDAGGASPVFVSAHTNIPVSCHNNLAVNTRSPAATNHYAYGYDMNNPAALFKLQLFPDPLNLDAAPLFAGSFSVPTVTVGSDLAINLAGGCLYYASGGNLVRVDLSNDTTTSAAVLYNENLTHLFYASNCVYATTVGGRLEKVTLGLNGSLTGATGASNLLAQAATAGAATDGAYFYGNSSTNLFVKIKNGTIGNVTPTSWTINQLVDPQGYFMAFVTTVMDTDAGYVFTGTDEHDPGTVSKVAVGAGDTPPVSRGLLYLIRGNWTTNAPSLSKPILPVNPAGHDARVGEVYLRSSIIDVQQGYAYFGHDNVPDLPLSQARVTKVQLSHKGSIKGNKVALPVVATLQSLNFYSHAATPATAFSSGLIRLAIYNDNGGRPGNLQWQSDPLANAGGWLAATSSVASGPLSSLTLGTGVYWLAWQVDSTLDVPSYTNGPAGNGFITWQPFGSFPANFQDPASPASNLFTSTPAGWDTNTADQASQGVATNHYGAELTSDNWSLYLAYDPATPAPPVFNSASQLANGNFNLQVTASSNFTVSILASTDLVNWAVIGTNLAGNSGLFLFQDTNAVRYPWRYYRATAP